MTRPLLNAINRRKFLALALQSAATAALIQELVGILVSTTAALIWANTTKVPNDSAGRFYGNEIVYTRWQKL